MNVLLLPSCFFFAVAVGRWRICRREGCSDVGAAMCQNSSFGTSQFGEKMTVAFRNGFYTVFLEKFRNSRVLHTRIPRLSLQ